MSDDGYDYSGYIELTQSDPPQVKVWLRDALGFVIEAHGGKDPRKPGRYLLAGRVTHIPSYLRQPVVDEGG